MNTQPKHDSTPVATLRATVTGHVQGVGFRLFVLQAARRLDLGGYVQNQHDRSVYVVAQGSRGNLEQLLGLLRKGPAGARVADVHVQWGEEVIEVISLHFEVRH